MLTRTYLLLGSNQGDRAQLLNTARVRIEILAGAMTMASSVYETAPWGKTDQPPFLNLVIAVDTELEPPVLLDTLLAIEKSLGRVRGEKWGPRTIDIDILFYGDRVVKESNLIVPHPALPERRFALTPLNEIAGDFVHPELKKSVGALLAECKDSLEVKVIQKNSGG